MSGKLPPHAIVYALLGVGIVGAGTTALVKTNVYPWQLWFTDMMDAQHVKAYEKEMRDVPVGSVTKNHRPHGEAYGTSDLRTDPEYTEQLKNPLESSPETLAKGEWGFTTYCAPCHGAQGAGDGPVRERAPGIAAPALVGDGGSLTIRNDGYIYLTIRNGGAIMPSYKLQMNDEEMWSVVSYLHELDKKS